MLLIISIGCSSFNGATTFQPWKYDTRIADMHATEIRFNGATTFQPWKYAATMLPSSMRYWLQWGHDFSAVEIDNRLTCDHEYCQLQWGHDFSAVEMLLTQ